jgi:hypothetical protein
LQISKQREPQESSSRDFIARTSLIACCCILADDQILSFSCGREISTQQAGGVERGIIISLLKKKAGEKL